jgi:hypothetical protein
MKIDRRLNLVVPVYGDDGKTVVAQVHSTPLSIEVVDRYFLILAQTYSQIFSRGLGIIGGPAVAMRMLREIATTEGQWENQPNATVAGVKSGLVEEMRRLTSVGVKQPDGSWNAVPLSVATSQGALSEEDVSEVENVIAFFTVASAMLPRAVRREMLDSALGLLGAQTSSSNTTEFFASLKTSTATGSSGEKSPAPASAGPGNATATRDGKPASVPR